MPKYGDETGTNQKGTLSWADSGKVHCYKMAENFRLDTVELLNQVC